MKKVAVKGTVKLSDNEISKVDEASFVGICIDSHLTWKNHIRAVFTIQLYMTSGGKLVFFLNYGIVFRSILLSLCIISFIQSHITYGIEVRGNICKSYLNCLLLSKKKKNGHVSYYLQSIQNSFNLTKYF